MMRNNRLLAGLLAGAVVLFWFAVVAPLRGDVKGLQESVPEYEAQHAEMAQLYAAYERMQVDERALDGWLQERSADFGLFAYVTEVAQRQRLVLASLRPSAQALTDRWQLERVKVELEDVPLPALIDFLHVLTTPQNVVRIDAFDLRGGPDGLSVRFEARTLTRRQSSGV